MCMSGGGGQSYQPDNSAVLAQIAAQERETQRLAQEAEATRAREAAALAAQKQEYQTALSNAFTNARNTVNQNITNKGFNPNDYSSYIDTELNRLQSSVPNLDPNPANYFSGDLANNILNNVTTDKRAQYTNQLTGMLPKDQANTLWSTTADDAILNANLNKSYDEASSQVLNAFNRGNINQQGYDYSKNLLDTQKKTGEGIYQDIGSGVLSNYKTALNDIITSGYNDAGGYTLGQTYDPTKYVTNVNNTYADQQSRLESDLLSALSGTEVFNPSLAINKGGVAQGATGAPTNQLQAALLERQKREEEARGVGTQGSF